MSDVSKAGEVFVEPLSIAQQEDSTVTNEGSRQHRRLTVQNRLAQSHDGGGKQHDDRLGYPRCSDARVATPRHQGVNITKSVQTLGRRPHDDDDIVNIHEDFDSVQGTLSSGEAILAVPRWPAIDVINGTVQGIWLPHRKVDSPTWHRVRAQEDIKGVPYDQRQRNRQPDHGQGSNGMLEPCSLH